MEVCGCGLGSAVRLQGGSPVQRCRAGVEVPLLGRVQLLEDVL
jgi:hypothetical protein